MAIVLNPWYYRKRSRVYKKRKAIWSKAPRAKKSSRFDFNGDRSAQEGRQSAWIRLDFIIVNTILKTQCRERDTAPRRWDRCPIGDTAIRAHDERGIQLPTTRVAKSRIRRRIRLMKHDLLCYVVAESLSVHLRFIHGIKDSAVSPWWVKSSVGFVGRKSTPGEFDYPRVDVGGDDDDDGEREALSRMPVFPGVLVLVRGIA
ncbi:hypothetical protein DBV15_08329 [Temnothorax longispinosus]|uniref:Uncharacterized protein n=1 Tax=Temnothorax longispinosus TaxID=300112 RepID=A0A4S2L640_9HYME|nr:hypothetical protein DBV15_08329 [Temnothorax longispinosus]